MFLGTIIMFGFIVIVITLSLRLSRSKQISISSSWKTKGFIGGYTGLLVIALVVSMFLPIETAKQHSISQMDLDQRYQQFYDAANEGRIDEVDSIYVANTWEFEVEDRIIEVISNNNEYVGVSVFAQRKETNDGIVELAYYTTRPMVEGYDLSHLIKPTQVGFENNTIKLSQPEDVHVNFTKFTNEFTISQFTGEPSLMDPDYSTVQIGPSLLFIKIPKDTELVDLSDIYINFVDEALLNQ
ncbi:hypothetical protein JCM9140_935 [Halalkalibacter wakoensis JCM 9140]|uniref:Uncharacterized protein n=2 Tax=Halalkalibacter wakoensis TaxID=127891 RepID=W4PZV2_9BACI|nr:hypothetical protein JCM9140_935 [Halalkalibacter wakoensis JCM 9140]